MLNCTESERPQKRIGGDGHGTGGVDLDKKSRVESTRDETEPELELSSVVVLWGKVEDIN